SRDLLSEMLVATERDGSLVVRARLSDGMEHVLDAWALPRLRSPVAGNAVPALPQDVAARELVSLSGRARRVDRRRGDRARRDRNDVSGRVLLDRRLRNHRRLDG